MLLGVESAAADGVLLRLTVKTTPGAQFRLQRAVRQAVKGAFDEAGIPSRPPPHRWPRTPRRRLPDLPGNLEKGD